VPLPAAIQRKARGVKIFSRVSLNFNFLTFISLISTYVKRLPFTPAEIEIIKAKYVLTPREACSSQASA
jgi:hypothetical protein